MVAPTSNGSIPASAAALAVNYILTEEQAMIIRMTIACSFILALAFGRPTRNEHKLTRSLVRRSA